MEDPLSGAGGSLRARLLDGVLARLPVVLFRLDADGVFTESAGHGLRRLGLADGQALGLNALDNFSDARPHLERALSGETVVYEATGTTADGERWCYLTYATFDEHTGSGVIAFAIDITEQKRIAEQQAKMAEQLQQAQKLESLGLLAGGIAHDFNNLLMGVLGHASLAQMEMPVGTPGERRIGQIMETAERASELCQQLLAYSGRGRFVVGPVDMSALVLSTARLLEVSAPKSVVLRYECAEQLPPVEADATQLRQIVMNLVVNAAEAIGNRQGMVTISTGVITCDAQFLRSTYFDDELGSGKYIFLEVSDNGCGMDAATRKQMFDPFFSTKMSGRGLGMAAVLGIVRGHQGALKVYSEPGKGTTVKVLLPSSVSEVVEAAEIGEPTPSQRGRGLIMVVDDEEIVREVAAHTLMHNGYEVVTAANGEEALARYREHGARIRLVLLDLMMPHKSGTEVFSELRQLNSELPIILSSGYNEQDTTNRFAGKGLSGFIQKPYTAQQLESLVSEILN